MRNLILHIVFLTFLGLLSCGKECDPNRQYVGKDYRTYCNTPAWSLVKAIEKRELNIAEKLIHQSPHLVNYQDLNYNNSLLFWATLNSNRKAVNLLLQNGAAVDILNIDDESPIELAAFNYTDCDSKILDSLIHYLSKENSEAQCILNKSLLSASSQPCLRKVKLLIAVGASPNSSYDNGRFVGRRSALSKSVIHHRYENLDFLLAHENVNLDSGTIIRHNGDTVTLKQLLLKDLDAAHLDQEKIRPIVLDLIAKIDSISTVK